MSKTKNLNSSAGLSVWRLRSGADKRFRAGHPWVYSNELCESPKGLEPGALVELRDAAGKFLARGYGNPQSLIAFRAVTRDEANIQPLAPEAVTSTLLRAGELRAALGLQAVSHRLCFGEADGLPGWVVDRYRLAVGQVFVVQAHTAGMDRLTPALLQILETYTAEMAKRYSEPSWQQTAVVLRNDLSVRKLEGLLEEDPRLLKEVPGMVLSPARILVRSASSGAPIEFRVDLLQGQKTGFFLDQAGNIELAISRLRTVGGSATSQVVRVLDLCCYVGQWGTQFARAFGKMGLRVEVVAVDASNRALELAKENIEAEGGSCEILRGDVLKDLGQLAERSFDLVISDPPALIKSRKDIPAGTHAYLQLNTQVFRLIRQGGAVICCSCSGLLGEDEFLKSLSKAAYRNGRLTQWIGRGGPAPDHPLLLEFPEGRYLKAWIGIVN